MVINTVRLGPGFTMSEDEARTFIARDPKNTEVLFPYLNGEDLNSHPEQKPSRWVINFWDWPLDRSAEGTWGTANDDQHNGWLRIGGVPADYPRRVAADFPELLAIVREKVKPERDRNARRERREKWWHFAEKCPALYHAIGRGHAFARHPEEWDASKPGLKRVLVSVQTSKYLSLSWQPCSTIFSHMTVVLATESDEDACILNSTIHAEWVARHSSSLETRLRYIPTDCFETFPWPSSMEGLAARGLSLMQARNVAMSELSVGYTSLMNAFHAPERTDYSIRILREQQRLVDDAVVVAYGWSDVSLGHGYHAVAYLPSHDRVRYTICENARLEILRRLLRLNRDRYDEEQRIDRDEGVASATAGRVRDRRGKRPKLSVVQGGLF